MRKLIFILLIGLLAVPVFAQENWGWARDIVPESWYNLCPDNGYGFLYPAISSNDSLIFASYYCLDSSQYFSGIGYSEYYDGQWQPLETFPIQVESDYPISLFYYDQDDTLLYFALDMPGGYGGSDIWASQFSDDSWSQPFNLGPVINSAGGENSPSVPDDDSRIYFNRGGDLMYSDKINGQYADPVALPTIINSDLTEYEPRISRDGNRLYFNRYGIFYLPDTMMVSYFSGGTWQQPTALNGYINYNNSPCPTIPASSYGPSFNFDGSKMYFSRFEVWGSFCDPFFGIRASELTTGIDENLRLLPSDISLSSYPNPFNGTTNITIEGNIQSLAEISIYDIMGRKIKSFEPAYLITWNGTDSRGTPVSSGIYFVKAAAAGFEKSLRITLLK